MSLMEEIIQLRLKAVIEQSQEFNFPDFIRALRKMTGFSRPEMRSYIGIHDMMLWKLETGSFSKMPADEYFVKLSTYYDLPKKLLVQKAEDFLSGKKENAVKDVKEVIRRTKGSEGYHHTTKPKKRAPRANKQPSRAL